MDGASIVQMGSEKHDIAVIVFNNPGIVDRGYRIGHIIPGKDGVSVISLYKWDFSIHHIHSSHY